MGIYGDLQRSAGPVLPQLPPARATAIYGCMDSDRVDLAVVGAGLNGSLLALAAGETGLSTALIDRMSLKSFADADFDGRTTAIAYTSHRLFAALGIWPDLADQAEPILDIRISDAGHDGRPSPLFLHFDHREAAPEGGEPQPMGWIVENRLLRAALLRRLAACPQVELIAPDEVVETARDPDRADLTLKSGRRVAARLVASAEGRVGTMREEAGIGARAWSYNQIAIVLVARHERPHRGVAQEKFLPGGPFAILPMRDAPGEGLAGEHRSSIVWTERADLARRLLELDGPRFQAEFARRFGDHLGHVEPTGPRWWFPLGLVHAERYIDTRLVLVGDAAHGLHPIAGQGYNLGVRDIAALVEVLVDTKRLGLDIGAADTLERYARWRRADNFTMVAATDLLNRLFSNDIKPVRLVRDIGLATVNRVPPLRRFFVRHAMGLIGDLPKLIQGERP
jgi:2-octaprenyl-6-methoxyphenol hydroxylase